MKYLYWVGVIVVLVVGILVARSIQVTPETATLIPFQQVSIPEEMGRAVFETLRAKIEKAPHLMLGVTPEAIEDLELWRGFFEAAGLAGLEFEVFLVEPKLPYVEIFSTAAHIDIKAEMSRYVDGLRAAQKQGLRTVLIVPSIYSSQLLKANPVDRVQTEYQVPHLSLSVTKFPVTRNQEKEFQPRCIQGEGVDREGTSSLGCVIVNLARNTYRKKIEPNKLSTLLEKTGPSDYLILLNRNPTTN